MLMIIVTMETHTPISSAYAPGKLCPNTTKIPAMKAPERERERERGGVKVMKGDKQ